MEELIENIQKEVIELNENYITFIQEIEETIHNNPTAKPQAIERSLSDIKGYIWELCKYYKVGEEDIDRYIDKLLNEFGLDDSIYYVVNFDGGIKGERLEMKISRFASYIISEVDIKFSIFSPRLIKVTDKEYYIGNFKTRELMLESFKLLTFITHLKNSPTTGTKQMYCVELLIVIIKIHLIIRK